jgi:hypothetical protein
VDYRALMWHLQTYSMESPEQYPPTCLLARGCKLAVGGWCHTEVDHLTSPVKPFSHSPWFPSRDCGRRPKKSQESVDLLATTSDHRDSIDEQLGEKPRHTTTFARLLSSHRSTFSHQHCEPVVRVSGAPGVIVSLDSAHTDRYLATRALHSEGISTASRGRAYSDCRHGCCSVPTGVFAPRHCDDSLLRCPSVQRCGRPRSGGALLAQGGTGRGDVFAGGAAGHRCSIVLGGAATVGRRRRSGARGRSDSAAQGIGMGLRPGRVECGEVAKIVPRPWFRMSFQDRARVWCAERAWTGPGAGSVLRLSRVML